LSQARYYTGDPSGAREVLAPLTRGDHPDLRAQALLASFEAAVGMRREARERIGAVLRGSNLDHHVAYSLGAAFAQLGELDASVVWLERAATTGLPCRPWFDRDPLLDPVRKHAGFAQLMNRLKIEFDQARLRTH
jgi:predicted Zn-dependent protease